MLVVLLGFDAEVELLCMSPHCEYVIRMRRVLIVSTTDVLRLIWGGIKQIFAATRGNVREGNLRRQTVVKHRIRASLGALASL